MSENDPNSLAENVPFSSLFSFQKWGKGKTPTFDEGEQSPLALYQKSALIVFESFWPFFFSRQRTKGDILDYLSVELGNRPKIAKEKLIVNSPEFIISK